MPSYLVERYLPSSRRAEVDVAAALLGSGVRHVRVTLVPEDETCLHLVEASSPDAVRDAFACAAITYERVVEAVE